MNSNTPIVRHFARLRLLLSDKLAAKLEDEYRADQRAYDKDSRQRTRRRQAQQRLARESRKENQGDDSQPE